MSAYPASALPFESPNMATCVTVSVAVTSTKPSPEAISWLETAPEFPQPVPAVLVSELPEAVAPTTAVQTTGAAPVVGGLMLKLARGALGGAHRH